MQCRVPRREFLRGIGAVTAATAASAFPLKKFCAAEFLYPPMDLSYFDRPISPAPGEIHFGYASITWSGNDRQAIEDIAALGFPGIQLRANVLKEFSGPAELRALLEKHQLKMVALSSGGVRIDSAVEKDEIAKHTANAKFVRDVGGLYLQVTDERPKDRAITSADYMRLGKLITEIGKRTADLGVSLGYHNHMGSLGERPEEVDQILEAADPRYATQARRRLRQGPAGSIPTVPGLTDLRSGALFLRMDLFMLGSVRGRRRGSGQGYREIC